MKKNSILDNLYYIAAISNIMHYHTERSKYDKHSSIFLKDGLTVSADLSHLGPDEFSLTDYEEVNMKVKVDKYSQEKCEFKLHRSFPHSKYIYISSDDFSQKEKLKRIIDMRPSLIEKATFSKSIKANFSTQEIETLNEQAHEMLKWAKQQVELECQNIGDDDDERPI